MNTVDVVVGFILGMTAMTFIYLAYTLVVKRGKTIIENQQKRIALFNKLSAEACKAILISNEEAKLNEIGYKWG